MNSNRLKIFGLLIIIVTRNLISFLKELTVKQLTNFNFYLFILMYLKILLIVIRVVVGLVVIVVVDFVDNFAAIDTNLKYVRNWIVFISLRTFLKKIFFFLILKKSNYKNELKNSLNIIKIITFNFLHIS